jgi:hypothetical protein
VLLTARWAHGTLRAYRITQEGSTKLIERDVADVFLLRLLPAEGVLALVDSHGNISTLPLPEERAHH